MKHPTRNHPRNLQRNGSRNHFGTIAMRYYPQFAYKTALRHFRAELKGSRGLLNALKELGYDEKQRSLTLMQVKVIEEFLGKME